MSLYIPNVIKRPPYQKPMLGELPSPDCDLSKDLILAWLFNDSQRSSSSDYKQVVDYSGHGYHGSTVGIFMQWEVNQEGPHIYFQGTSTGYVTTSRIGYLLGSANTSVTVATRVLTRSVTSTDGIFDFGPLGSKHRAMSTRFASSNIALVMDAAAFVETYAFTDINTWHTWVAVYNGQAGILYLDGIKVIDVAYTSPLDFTDNGNFQVGCNYRVTNPLSGSMHWCYVWNRALDVAEVQQIQIDPHQMFGGETLWVPDSGITIPIYDHHYTKNIGA